MDKGLVRRSTGSLTLLALWHAFIAMLTLGCEPRVSAPPLVELSDVGPAELEPGDRLELHGKGFPQGRTARVRLHGTVFRAEASRLGHKTIEAEGTVLAPDRLRVDIESGFVERLCGTGDSASHATFEGSVEVAFASSTPDAPPVVAELEHVRLDVIPSSTRASVMAARKEKGERILHALGLTPGAPTSRGLPLEAITPGSVADHAGLRVGDILERVDGLRVLSLADIAPASSRTMGLALWRPDEGRTELKQLALKAPGLRALAEDLAPAIGMVTLGLLVLVFFLLPGPSSLRRLEAAFAQIARRTDLRAWFRSSAFARLGTTAVSLAGLALFASISSTLVRGFDGLLLFSAAASLLIAAQAFHHRGLRDFVRSLTATTLFLLVMAASLALGIAQLGALELSDAVRAQGAMPWQFSAVQHPSCAALSLAFLAALCRILRVHGKPPLRDHLLSQDFARAPALAPPPRSRVARAGLILAAGLVVALFFGGWAPLGRATSAVGSAVGLGLFVAKTWLVTALVDGFSHLMPALGARASAWLVVRRHLPAIVVGALAFAASRWLSASDEIELTMGLGAAGIAALVMMRMATRVRVLAAAPEPHASPFL